MLLPGRRVTLDDGDYVRELIISDVAVTLVNVFTDRVEGWASPETRIETWFCDDHNCAFRWMLADEDGNWFADFATPMGTGVPEEDATVEIKPYHYSTVVVRDEDDDKTVVHWVGIIPIVEANLTDNMIWTYDWPTGGEAHLSIFEDGDVVYTATQELVHPEWNRDIYVADFLLGDFQLAPGQTVTINNSDMEKSLEVVDLSVIRVDNDADTIEGYAPPGSEVDTSYLCNDEGCAWRLSIAGEDGIWLADYGKPSDMNSDDPAFQNTFDIQPGFCNLARVFDDDRDNTRVTWCGPSLEYTSIDIFSYNPTNGEIKRITENLPDTDEFNPSWSPDGKKIAHDVVDPGVSHAIYITDVKTGESVPLRGAEAGGNDAVWSPNGKWIVFDRAPVFDYSLYMVPAKGGKAKRVRPDAFSADWAPDGKRLVFHQPSDGTLRTIPVDGGKGRETIIAKEGMNPAWSPDGKWIAYEHAGDIWKVRVNVQGTVLGKPVKLTGGPLVDGQPAWSADSKTIFFHSVAGDDFDIWSVPAAGGEPVWLNGAPVAGDTDPSAARKGSLIAYASLSPEGQAPRKWVAAFTYDLPANYWTSGMHSYQFWAKGDAYTDHSFEVSDDGNEQLYEGFVLIRPGMLRAWSEEGCMTINAIHPAQPTRFHIGWGAYGTYAEALEFYANGFEVTWDAAPAVEMTRHMVSPMNDAVDWVGYTCTFTRP
jgi:Tol biopolymer transport system component